MSRRAYIRCVGPCGVYNSGGMEELAPEDLVEEWSDCRPARSAPARAWAATSSSAHRLRRHGPGLGRAAARPARLLQDRRHQDDPAAPGAQPRVRADVPRRGDASPPACTTRTSCEIYELGEEGTVLYLAMEWVNGDSLVHMLRGIERQDVAAHRAALRRAHRRRRVRGPARRARADRRRRAPAQRRAPRRQPAQHPGVARGHREGDRLRRGQGARARSHQATVAGQVKGKVAYMAPEQIGGRQLRPAHRRLRDGRRALRDD